MRARPVNRASEKQDRVLAGWSVRKNSLYIPNGPGFPLLRSSLVARGGVRRVLAVLPPWQVPVSKIVPSLWGADKHQRLAVSCGS